MVEVRPSHGGGPLGGMVTVTPRLRFAHVWETGRHLRMHSLELLGGADGTHDPRGGLVHDGREEA